MYVCKYVCMYVYVLCIMYVYVCVCIVYVCKYVCMYVYALCMYVCMYTYMHTYNEYSEGVGKFFASKKEEIISGLSKLHNAVCD